MKRFVFAAAKHYDSDNCSSGFLTFHRLLQYISILHLLRPLADLWLSSCTWTNDVLQPSLWHAVVANRHLTLTLSYIYVPHHLHTPTRTHTRHGASTIPLQHILDAHTHTHITQASSGQCHTENITLPVTHSLLVHLHTILKGIDDDYYRKFLRDQARMEFRFHLQEENQVSPHGACQPNQLSFA